MGLNFVQSAEEGQLKARYPEAYGPGLYPSDEDFIDYNTVTASTQFYHYASPYDTVCMPDTLEDFEAMIPDNHA